MQNVKYLLEKRVPKKFLFLLKKIGKIADRENLSAFLVGGFTRNLFLVKDNLDFDIVVEGDGIFFAKKVADVLQGKLVSYAKFGTASVFLKNNLRIDFASARSESYEFPAALPDVELSSIKNDLFRRDFTINSIALKINEKNFGEIFDPFKGIVDLEKKTINILHNQSFIDDPTRIFRAVRFEQRLGFKMGKNTENLLKDALNKNLIGKLSPERLRNEIFLILKEKNVKNILKRMDNFSILTHIHPNLFLNWDLFDKIDNVLFEFKNEKIEEWLIYFFALIDNLILFEVEELTKKINFSKKEKKVIFNLKKNEKNILKFLEDEKNKKESLIYRKLNIFSIEELLFLKAKIKSKNGKEKLENFLRKIRNIKISIDGNTLLNLGFKEGPYIKKVLNKILDAKIDGKIRNKKEEILYAKKFMKGFI